MHEPNKDDLLEAAWGIIANVYGCDWSKASPEWRKAAERWRDEYLPLFSKRFSGATTN